MLGAILPHFGSPAFETTALSAWCFFSPYQSLLFIVVPCGITAQLIQEKTLTLQLQLKKSPASKDSGCKRDANASHVMSQVAVAFSCIHYSEFLSWPNSLVSHFSLSMNVSPLRKGSHSEIAYFGLLVYGYRIFPLFSQSKFYYTFCCAKLYITTQNKETIFPWEDDILYQMLFFFMKFN